ncbi:hypothetical protein L2E82_46476 [Cichorium intybus]|uniref:Uncharacterized protein n=1 Tax=Cichorium intybus TaxID=13427 RepID=A0ACB8YT81_CICIN|nr:hypothetical protein L2E82_46476 [Cichorium intybus]
MTMQTGRVGDHGFRAKMAELRLISDKEIEIQQRRSETSALSLSKSLQSSKSRAQETVLNQEKIGKLKAQLRSVEDDLVKALSVKTRKEAKKMAIADSISATKARLEEHKKIVADQRARKDEFAQIMSDQSEALKENEEKHKQNAECREEIEEAISWYNRVLGFRIETGLGVKFIFNNINKKNPNEECYFTIRFENDNYSLLDCHPHVSEAKNLIQELNTTNGLYHFVRTMREKFQEVAADGTGNLAESGLHLQETSVISMTAPFSSVSTDSGSGSPAMEDNSRETRNARHVQRAKSSIRSPGSASSLRRRQSPRFKAKK